MVYLVTYELKVPGRNYAGLFNALKESDKWWHYLQSSWLISTTETAEQIWVRLSSHVDKIDLLLIVRISGDYYGQLPKDAWTWIREQLNLHT